jgi:hypothetical protein
MKKYKKEGIVMPRGLYNKKKKLKREGIFHRTAEELREFAKENDIKLLELREYLRKINHKKIKKENS